MGDQREHSPRVDGLTGSDDTIAYPDFITEATISTHGVGSVEGGGNLSALSGVFNPLESPSDTVPSWNPVISPSTNPDLSPQNANPGGSTSSLSDYRLAELTRLNSIPITRDMRLEDVGPWSAISGILSVYLRYLHSLFPLVHKPSFAQALAMRKDQTDRAFAALILGLGTFRSKHDLRAVDETPLNLVAYTIGQSPLRRLANYTRQELHWLQRRCHSASMAMLDRRYKRVSVDQIVTLMTQVNLICLWLIVGAISIVSPSARIIALSPSLPRRVN